MYFFTIIKNLIATNIIVKYWLTGVLPAFRDGISPLTATTILSTQPKFHGLCGFMHAEVQIIAQTYISSSPELQSYDIDAVMHTLWQWHSGYCFCGKSHTPIASVYNPQYVFLHLQGLSDSKSIEPHKEIEAPHTNKVLDAIDESTFPEIFLLTISSKLDAPIHYHIPPAAVQSTSSIASLAPSLLYFFGILTFAGSAEIDSSAKSDSDSETFLGVPNKTMQQVVCFHHCISILSSDGYIIALQTLPWVSREYRLQPPCTCRSEHQAQRGWSAISCLFFGWIMVDS